MRKARRWPVKVSRLPQQPLVRVDKPLLAQRNSGGKQCPALSSVVAAVPPEAES